MEVIKGGSLKQVINKRGYFNEEEASLIIRSLLSAVEHVHSKNYVHRDLKPENILINDENDLSSIKLADFGLSASFRINTTYSLTEKMGTLLFMAPEQTKNYSYGKVSLSIIPIFYGFFVNLYFVEDRYLGYRNNNVHFDKWPSPTLR